MPELPDIELYLHALQSRIAGQRLDRIRVASPFLVRSFDPAIDLANGKKVLGLRRLGERLVWELEDPSPQPRWLCGRTSQCSRELTINEEADL